MPAARPSLENAGLRCPNCHYDLAGLPGATCPECGQAFDPVALRNPRPNRRWFLALVILIIEMYSPFAWLFFVHDDPIYVRYWMYRWPVLPAAPLSMFIDAKIIPISRSLGEAWPYVFMAMLTLAMMAAFIWLATRGIRWLIVTALIAGGLFALNGWLAYLIFAA